MDEAFDQAQARVRALKKTPSNTDLLELYALYKQGSLGNCEGKRPSMLDPRGRAKFDAWSKKRGMTKEQARAKYVALVEQLETKYA